MRDQWPIHWQEVKLGAGIFAITVLTCAQSFGTESVRAELIRRQQGAGLSLVSVGCEGIAVLSFASRPLPGPKPLPRESGKSNCAISPDGTEIAYQLSRKYDESAKSDLALGIIRLGEGNIREYSDIGVTSDDLCWSYDKTKLAGRLRSTGKEGLKPATLQILDLGSEIIREAGSFDATVTSQCWSPDGGQMVYQDSSGILVYDIKQGTSRMLANGKDATWSPDGNWIAFHDDDGYYVVRPSGNDRKLLFKKKRVLTELWWSPDSRFVAYVAEHGVLGGSSENHGRLWVRRLDDNVEDWVTDVEFRCFSWKFQWVGNAKTINDWVSPTR
jgi:dipeptidyl aminopeptidase/acylaminoacyl peptidase